VGGNQGRSKRLVGCWCFGGWTENNMALGKSKSRKLRTLTPGNHGCEEGGRTVVGGGGLERVMQE